MPRVEKVREDRAMIAVDTHAHIFATGLPLAVVRRYAPSYDATADDYLAALDANAIRCGVLVQPSFLGTDNSYMLAALRQYPNRLRGIAVVDPDISETEIDRMDAAGVVGIRLNLQRLPIPRFTKGAWPKLLAHLRRRDWQVEIIRDSSDLPFLIEPLLDAGVNVVVDHFGRPDATLGTDDPGFQYLLAKGSTRRVWVKLSGGYRNWPDDGPGEIGRQSAALLLGAMGPERLIWGSDWPHTQNEDRVSYARTKQDLADWVPDESERRTIMQDTALRLFRFNMPVMG
jgi:predicted TIM-barrel fold metal-dependent hydrolase